VGSTLSPPDEYQWTVRVRQRCGLLSNYYDDLFLFLTLYICGYYGRPIWNRAGHYIFVLWSILLPFFLLLFVFVFLAYSQPSQIGCVPYFHTWRGLSANLECRSEMCCTRLAEIQDTKIVKKFPICAPLYNFVGCIFSTMVYRQSEKKLAKHQYLFHMFSQYGELRSVSGWDRFINFGHRSKFQRVSRVGFVTAPTSLNGRQPNFARCLAVFWAGWLLGWFVD